VRARWLVFAAGAALFLIAELPQVEELTFDLLTIHLLQNVVLAEWAPALLAFGLPPSIGRPLAEKVPWFLALPIWLGTYFAWHVPALYDAALEHPDSLLHLEHATYLAAGFLFWLPVAHGPLNSGAKAGYIFAAFILCSPLGLLLALLPEPIYDFYAEAPGRWGLDPLADQQIAGVTMASEQAIVFFGVFAYYFARFLQEQDAL
jgi:putative membrane protein